jgi:protein SCO1/2
MLLSLPRVEAAPAPAPAQGFEQRLGATLPLELRLNDESGSPLRLGELFGRVPVVMVPGYFRCRNLCSTVLDGVLEALAGTGLERTTYRVIAVSIDPREGPSDAAHRRATAGSRASGGAVRFLTGGAQATARLAAALGLPYRYDAEHDEYIHPAGFVVATPAGAVARYFPGVRFAPRELRLALVEASAGRAGSLADRLVLLCSHYDPRAGRYTFAVMASVRAGCLGGAVGLGLWLWRRRTGRAQ